MPALPDMLLAHAQADARADLVAGDGGGKKVASADRRLALQDGEDRRQRDRADVKDADPVHVVELEALHQRAVDQHGMRRRQPLGGAPDTGAGAAIDLGEGRAQDPAPGEVGAVDRATERIEHEELDAAQNVAGNPLVAESRHEARDRRRVRISRLA